MKIKNELRSESGVALMEYFAMATAIAVVTLIGFPSIVLNLDSLHTKQAAELAVNTTYPSALIP